MLKKGLNKHSILFFFMITQLKEEQKLHTFAFLYLCIVCGRIGYDKHVENKIKDEI